MFDIFEQKLKSRYRPLEKTKRQCAGGEFVAEERRKYNRGGLQRGGGEIEAKEEDENRGGFLLFKHQTSTITI